MPLNDTFAARMAEPDFWPLYFFDADAPDVWDDEAEEQESQATVFDLGDGIGLELRITLAHELIQLAVTSPDGTEGAEVGWDDQACFFPHVMPWRELDLLCRAAALHDPSLRHPGPMLALLCRFAFLAEGDDLDGITPLLDAAFASVRPGPEPVAVREETRDWFDLRDLRGSGVTWSTRPDGHPAVQQLGRYRLPLYSMRFPDSEDFPFAAWATLLDRAGRLLTTAAEDTALSAPAVRRALDRCTALDGHTQLPALATALSEAGYAHAVLVRALTHPVHRTEAAWAVETLAGLPQGELVARWSGPSPLTASGSWRLSLTLPARRRTSRFGQEVADELNAALREVGLGSAEANGGTSRQTANGWIRESDNVDVLIRDDLTAGVAVISRVLHSHQAAATATLKHDVEPYGPISLPPAPA
ncbi:hypothetical protein AB0M28_30460 [Streptomyces sp. NPDC051940]|uniref:hypothetical protein n=1 Tax=Streptomyces sp. NPDC051940 TaxID=3155675 RepID=UPI00341F1C76